MAVQVFIDGGHGTTGLEIAERLAGHGEVALIALDPDKRRDEAARRDAFAAADIAILCLPDDAAREAAAIAADADTRVIDASSAHRTAPNWVYGFPELEKDRRAAIASAERVSNPGCYPTGFLALVRPLVRDGLLPEDAGIGMHALSGYSGGGKAMIEEFESGKAGTAARAYGLSMAHKHLPEMRVHAELDTAPVFAPLVIDTYRGMIVEILLAADAFARPVSAESIRQCYAQSYAGEPLIAIAGSGDEEPPATLPIERCAGTDRLELAVFADEESSHFRLIALLDNLGKGAGGAAVQNLNIMAGFEETAGLRL